MAESSLIGEETLWEKEKLLVSSNFSFSRSVFKGLVQQTCKNQGLFGKGLTTPREKPFENIVGKGENAGNQHFLLFPPCFLSYQRQKSSLSYIYFAVCNAFNLVTSKILSFGKE